jgi:alanyl-tRNA synthetase
VVPNLRDAGDLPWTMPMTERLYYTDAYLAAFDARVVERAEDGRRVYLDRTAFYPTSGGQPNDLGEICGVPVEDVVDEGERIAHRLARPLPAGSDAVTGAIDWPRRRDLMQQHTGQHLLSAVFEDVLGHATVSVHFGAESSTLDLAVDALSADELRQIEARANAIVRERRPVVVSFEDAAAARGLRKAAARTGTLRIVAVEGVDRSACGGTHVANTAEIGPIVLLRTERVRQATRIEFLAGDRVLRRAHADHEALARIARTLTVAPGEAPAAVLALTDQLKEAQGARKRLEEEALRRRAESLAAAATPDADGVRRLTEAAADSPDALRALAQACAALPRTVFVGAAAGAPLVVAAASADSGVDAARAIKALLGEIAGKGGGSPRVAQASLADAATRDAALARLARLVAPALLGLVLLSPLGACRRRDDGTVRLTSSAPAPRSSAESPPVPLNPNSPVEYPAALAAEGIEGTVLLRLYVDASGAVRPDSIRVAESSGYPALDSAAIAGARRLRYAPALKGGDPVATLFMQPIQFRRPRGVGRT